MHRLHLARTAAVAAAILTAGSGVEPAATMQACDASPLRIRDVAVWTREGLIPGRDVTFRDGRVAAIEAAGSGDRGKIRTIDGRGHTLLPGLIDLHLHFTIPGGLPAGDTPRTDAAEMTGRQLLRSGVTSGRLHLASLTDAADLKRRAAEPCAALPRLQVGGPGLSGAAEKDYPNFQGAKTIDDAAAKIAAMRQAGIDWVAIHDADRFAPEVLEAIAKSARAANIRIMAAGNTAKEIASALGIRPDTLDYFDRSPDPRYATSVLDSIRAGTGLTLVPTPGLPYRSMQYIKNPALLERPENFEGFSPADRAFVLENAKKDLASPERGRTERVMASLPEKFAQLRATGVPMAIGTDAGSPLHLQSNAIWWELQAWRSLGASNREVLVAATENAARVLGRPDVGRLTVGSQADFVLYRTNPEEGVFDERNVLAVGKGGVLYVDRTASR